MAINDVYLLSLRQRAVNQTIVNVFALRCDDNVEPGQATFQTVADQIKEWLRVRQAQNLAYETWRALKVYGAGVTYSTTAPFRTSTIAYEGSHTGTLAGALLTDCNALQIAAVIRWRTQYAGRRKRGRTYLAGIADAQYASGALIAGAVTGLQTQVDAMIASLGAGGTNTTFTLGVWSERTATKTRYNPATKTMEWDGTAQDPAGAFEAVLSGSVQSTLYTQRRRVIGVGS